MFRIDLETDTSEWPNTKSVYTHLILLNATISMYFTNEYQLQTIRNQLKFYKWIVWMCVCVRACVFIISFKKL